MITKSVLVVVFATFTLACQTQAQIAGEAPPLPVDLVEFPLQSPWTKAISEKNLNRLKEKGLVSVEEQVKALSYKQAVQEIPFQRGTVFIDAGNLVWKKLDGQTVILARKEEHSERGIANILISPDGEKIAYSTTLSGSDQHVWYIKSISEVSEHLMAEPILVRMDGFSWGQDSNIVYYSHFAKIEDVLSETEPIVKVRARSLVTGKNTDIFDHKQRANFAIFDVDGGQTLIAHRILGPGAGIKALLSIYKGKRNANGSYSWSPLIAPNKSIGHFLGVLNKNGKNFAVMHSDFFGDKYGISMVPVDGPSGKLAQSIQVVGSSTSQVLHNSQMIQGRLFLEYYDPKTLYSSMKIVNSASGKVEKEIRFSDFNLMNYGSLSLPVSFLGGTATFKYTDVLNNVQVFSYDLNKKTLQTLKNLEKNPFDAKNIHAATIAYTSKDGATVRALKIYPVDTKGKALKPSFFYLKSYGMIGIKYVAEPLEAQLTVLRGGVYLAPDVRGGAGPSSKWQVQGARDFNLRYQDIDAAADYITKEDPMYAKYNFNKKDVTVALGRSYNGAGILEMAARYPSMAKMYVAVVPVWDFVLQLQQGRFGVISHSDLFPEINSNTGEMILGDAFWKNVEEHSPAQQLHQIPSNLLLYVYTGGRDDRVDQIATEERFAKALSDRMGDNFHYIQNPTASHGQRWYLDKVFTEIDLIFGTQVKAASIQ